MNSFFINNELEEMNTVDIQSLVASRLEDLADRVDYLTGKGDWKSAELLRREGLALAKAYDTGFNFFYVNDLTNR